MGPHCAKGDAGVANASAVAWQAGGDGHDRGTLGLGPADLVPAEGAGVAQPGDGDFSDQPDAGAVTQEIVDVIGAGRGGDRRAKRQKGDGEITVRVRGKEVAADGAHVAHLRAANLTGNGGEEDQVRVGDDLGERHAGTHADAVACAADRGQRGIGAADDAGKTLIACVHVAHHQRAAGKEAGIGTHGAGRFGRGGVGFDRDGHQAPSNPM